MAAPLASGVITGATFGVATDGAITIPTTVQYGDFNVTFSWLGSAVYQLELIPVPEPLSVALLALGGRARRCQR